MGVRICTLVVRLTSIHPEGWRRSRWGSGWAEVGAASGFAFGFGFFDPAFAFALVFARAVVAAVFGTAGTLTFALVDPAALDGLRGGIGGGTASGGCEKTSDGRSDDGTFEYVVHRTLLFGFLLHKERKCDEAHTIPSVLHRVMWGEFAWVIRCIGRRSEARCYEKIVFFVFFCNSVSYAVVRKKRWLCAIVERACERW